MIFAPSWAGSTSTASSACAPTPTRRTDAEVARAFGAEGIGLCRTEHMFFDEDRILAMRR
jgi:phosphoenolpyruvate synthase/pyruvate phosphate dikinase